MLHQRPMRIEKILNNNAVISHDARGNEIIAVGKGLGFNHKVRDSLDPEQVLKTYTLSNKGEKDRLFALVQEIPFDCIALTEEIIADAKETLRVPLSQGLVINLADHINFMLERYRENTAIPSLLTEEIRQYYHTEWKVGKRGVEKIRARYGLDVRDDEAAALAMHIINAEGKDVGEETISILQGITRMIEIIKKFYGVELREDSLDYSRMVIHFKFLMKKIYGEEVDETEMDDTLYRVICQQYPREEKCVGEIGAYLEQEHRYTLTEADRLYLLMHIAKIIKKI